MKKVIIGGSLDPITYGHDDLIRRAAKQFDRLTAGIGVNSDKEGKYLFSLQERLYLTREVLKDVLNVDVVAYRGLTTHFAKEHEYNILVRGLRTGKDFEEEQQLDRALKRQEKDFETIYLNAKQSMQDLSSSAAKNVLSVQGDIRSYVPMIVKQAMEERLLGQHMLGISGIPGSGKSFTTQQFLAFCKKNGIPSHHLDLDIIGHEVQNTLQEPMYQTARQKIIQTFGNDVANENGSINREMLRPKVFGSQNKKNLEILNDIMREPMQTRTKRLMYNQKGLFLYDAALIADAGTSSLVNNNVVLVDVSPEIQIQRLTQRLKGKGIAEEKIPQIVSEQITSQLTTDQKRNMLLEAVNHDKHGKIIDLQSPYNEQEAEVVFNKMLAQVDTFGELRFAGLLNRLGVKEDARKLFTELRNIYDRPIAPDAKRDEIAQKMKGSYHKRLHVVDCMNELYEVKHLLENPDAVECALLFHDVVYDPMSKTNEEESALYVEKILTQRGLPKDFIERVKQLILVTKPGSTPRNNDEKYIMDIDMSIFGKNDRKYIQYAKDVKKEYHMYSEEEYTTGRRNFLHTLIDKKNIYHTDYFADKYNDKVESNIGYEILMADQKKL